MAARVREGVEDGEALFAAPDDVRLLVIQPTLENPGEHALVGIAADLPRLPYTEMVVKESMRLYPPAWGIGRLAINDCELNGYRILAGTNVLNPQTGLFEEHVVVTNTGFATVQ